MKIRIASLALAFLLGCASKPADSQGIYPLPEERGAAGILQALESLPVYARVLYTIAHPDDESAGTLVWLARRFHARTALFSLTRGDGGQNLLGDEKYEAMGLLRTGELVQACHLYGVEPYFATVFEFGFSKSAEETLAKWGKERTLEEVVRFIRTWRPVVIISQFGSDGGGHGHHQAAGLLTHEAFRASGDERRFPEHMSAGLLPWQARRLYRRERGGPVAVPVGDYDPILGRSYREIGAEGYSRHRSQGAGAAFSPPGTAYDTYRLADALDPDAPHESGFFDSIDTSLMSILDLAEAERRSVDSVRPLLEKAQAAALEARSLFVPSSPENAAPAIAAGLESIRRALKSVEASSLSVPRKRLLEDALEEKKSDFENAMHATLGIYLSALAEQPVAAPGETLRVRGHILNRGSGEIEIHRINLNMNPNLGAKSDGEAPVGRMLQGGSDVPCSFSVTVDESAAVTEPFWSRTSPSDSRYQVGKTRNPFLPFESPLISLSLGYRYRGTEAVLTQPVRSRVSDPIRGAEEVDFQIIPAISIAIEPNPAIVPFSRDAESRAFVVSVRNGIDREVSGRVRLKLPSGWTSDPPDADFRLARRSEVTRTRFRVRIPGQDRPTDAVVEATATLGAEEYTRGYRIISYPGNWTRHLYAPARSQVRLFDLRMPQNLRVGYVPGAGDEIPEALTQLGAGVKILSPDDLAEGNLTAYSAIVTGIRAFNVNRDLRANNHRLLEYVKQGGTMIVQYCRPEGQNGLSFAPYPITLSASLRITVEDSPVRILDPEHPVLRFPNRITQADFEGWVQERGLYFAGTWDPRYTPLLSGADPGESDLRGGMLIARYGAGYYIYTAYAWFRQLPAGIPGAYRILANMLALGSRSN